MPRQYEREPAVGDIPRSSRQRHQRAKKGNDDGPKQELDISPINRRLILCITNGHYYYSSKMLCVAARRKDDGSAVGSMSLSEPRVIIIRNSKAPPQSSREVIVDDPMQIDELGDTATLRFNAILGVFW